MSKLLGVGIIGASATRGWAKISHVPAVRGLEGLKLVAVSAGTEEKSAAAAKAYNARSSYASGLNLIHDPAVDIVSIAVKVPDHRELVLAAAAAGKHVYCEWPLGRNVSETEELANAATAAGIRTAIGLQLRGNTAVQQAKQLLQAGRIGRVLSARILSTTAAFGPSVEPEMAFAEIPENGVSLITIQGAHTFDLAMAVLGSSATISALATTQYPEVRIGDSAELSRRVTSDHVMLMAQLNSGGSLSIEVIGGHSPQAPTHFEITGTEGSLTLSGGAMRGVQSGGLKLSLNGEIQTLKEAFAADLPETAVNVAQVYAMLRDDIVNDTSHTPDFNHAVRLSRFVEAVTASSLYGLRKEDKAWLAA